MPEYFYAGRLRPEAMLLGFCPEALRRADALLEAPAALNEQPP